MSGKSANPILTLTVLASGAITANKLVKHNGAQCAAGEAALGVATYSEISGNAVGVVAIGTAMAISGAAVAVGADLESDASGRVITRVAGVSVGRALQATTAADQNIEIIVK